ncbi:serine/threonine protein kinase [Solitalea longa]|uniref:Serine/threonine protein kinase n=1 Tax=Solitalea longa TaxID=2079460 RepID=A0A2S5A158_9SPHI|nr:PASTA domain-containing protein [Solitalea longa]POY36306.1 serine/threonine protein kinase [Solitalea longa]
MLKKLFAFLLTPEFRKNLLFAALLLFLLVFITIFSLRVFTKHGESLTLPDLSGLTVKQAEDMMTAGNIEFKVDTVFIEGKTPGTIVQQDPDPKTEVKEGRTVYLLIQSFTPPEIKLPDLEGKTLTEARAVLEGYGLKMGEMIYKSDIAKDVVLGITYRGMTINAGTGLPKGATVGLVLGNGFGAASINIPDLTGLTLQEAIFTIRGNSLLLGKVTYEGEITDSTQAKVYRQDPVYVVGDTTTIQQGSMINIFLHQE